MNEESEPNERDREKREEHRESEGENNLRTMRRKAFIF